jgi:uncharacterized membrane protein YeiH
MHDPRYLVAVLVAVVAGGLTQSLAQRFDRLIAYVDALGIGVYAVVGTDKALANEVASIGAVLVGMCNAAGGGMLRDVLTRNEPLVFKPGQLYALAALSGCLIFVLLTREYHFETQNAAWIAIGTTLALRVLAIRYNWKTRPISTWNAWFSRRPDDSDENGT